MTEPLDPIERLSRDVTAAGRSLSRGEARFLVDTYYQLQENRKRDENQVRSLASAGEPHAVLAWLATQSRTLENQVKRALNAYSAADPLGQWARDQVGIGPVIAAGLLAHIDVAKAPTAGHVWRFAGLDPTTKWGKGQKRPWNADLKVLCWKIGESFVKVSGRDDAVYAQLYLARKAYEEARNAAGAYADQAAELLATKNFRAETTAKACYQEGRLPPGHLHARAKRYAVKLFLAHYLEEGRRLAGLEVVAPYPLAHLGHAHKIEVPAGGTRYAQG